MAKSLKRLEAIRKTVARIHLKPSQIKILRQKNEDDARRYFRNLEDFWTVHELDGYFAALQAMSTWHTKKLTQTRIKKLHALVLGKGVNYRTGQNAVFDAEMKTVLYLPPKAKEVPHLMRKLLHWVNNHEEVPCPIRAGIIHFGINSIHPYYDGNGRCARLATRWVLARGHFDLGGFYCLEKFYARDLERYYNALSVNQSHCRRYCDITSWLEYFLEGMVYAFEGSLRQMTSL